jgi:hypothetical protein
LKVVKIHISDDAYHNSVQGQPALKLNANQSLFQHDSAFDWLYPEHIEAKSRRHWTPLAIAQRAAGFLAEPGARLLDIGSGVGKFCLAGAYHYPETFFYGVEQRHELILYAEDAKNQVQLPNAHFIYANMTQVKFVEFDHFYFYNSFYENIDPEDPIDDTIATSYSLYTYYTRYLFNELDKKPVGTRLVTFHTANDEVPPSYRLADMDYNALLKMWIKK